MGKKKSKARRSAKRVVEDVSELLEAQVDLPEVLPVLPAKDIVAFPSVMMSLYVARPSSIEAVEWATAKDKLIFMVAQKSQESEDPAATDLHRIGVVANIVRTLKLTDGRYKVLLQGIIRARALRYTENGKFLNAKIESLLLRQPINLSAEDEVIVNRIRANLQVLVENEHLPEEMLLVTEEITDPAILTDVILAHYKLDPASAQPFLEELDPLRRLRLTDKLLTDNLNQFFISEKIKDKASHELTKGQREYYLREQMKQIQRELGDSEGSSDELALLKKSLLSAKLPPAAQTEADRQFKRLERMPSEASEYSLLRTYLEWMAELPWAKASKDKLDLKRAQTVLDEDHFGLEKAKERIVEYLSVRKLKPDSKGPILCFVGPPGVGKTSLGKSIARALGRSFVRMSLGGMRDEAEIRGHRRTYVGALPGRIVQCLRQASTNNPVFVLDELDKIGADFRGDPASALLEVLDPQQNTEFQDHYLGVSFDLSNVLFVATANTLDTIPDALLDRLEVIFISGYTTEEKLNICKRYLIPRQLKENGLFGKKIDFDNSALLFLIERYTREAGVRNLEREIGSLCRKIARKFAESKQLVRRVSPKTVQDLLGSTKFDPEQDEEQDAVGLARGLAWTVHGGEMMPVEVSVAKGTGQLALTGQLGNIMQESAQAAVFFARANAASLGLDADFHQKNDMHIHVPGGATPKDGPSAGITIAAALVSALSGRKVSRDYAMTGEITLRGAVLPVGGLKEKALAALRYGIKNVIIPFENIKDVEEVPKEQREKIKFIPVKHISEVLEMVLTGKPRVVRVQGKGKRRIKARPISAQA
ncbi:MAG: endopeptidase La [Oligoflexia bacterium]|nr:endopeptidase La [Oligoflexia bacterium]